MKFGNRWLWAIAFLLSFGCSAYHNALSKGDDWLSKGNFALAMIEYEEALSLLKEDNAAIPPDLQSRVKKAGGALCIHEIHRSQPDSTFATRLRSIARMAYLEKKRCWGNEAALRELMAQLDQVIENTVHPLPSTAPFEPMATQSKQISFLMRHRQPHPIHGLAHSYEHRARWWHEKEANRWQSAKPSAAYLHGRLAEGYGSNWLRHHRRVANQARQSGVAWQIIWEPARCAPLAESIEHAIVQAPGAKFIAKFSFPQCEASTNVSFKKEHYDRTEEVWVNETKLMEKEVDRTSSDEYRKEMKDCGNQGTWTRQITHAPCDRITKTRTVLTRETTPRKVPRRMQGEISTTEAHIRINLHGTLQVITPKQSRTVRIDESFDFLDKKTEDSGSSSAQAYFKEGGSHYRRLRRIVSRILMAISEAHDSELSEITSNIAHQENNGLRSYTTDSMFGSVMASARGSHVPRILENYLIEAYGIPLHRLNAISLRERWPKKEVENHVLEGEYYQFTLYKFQP